MAKHSNATVITSNLLLNLDFKNSKRFTGSFGTNLVQDPTYNPSTWGTFSVIKTTGIDAPDGSKNAVRMTSKVRSSTYTLTTNVATVTMYNHGFTTGQNHYFDFTSGTGVDSNYTVTVTDANTFTIPVTAANGSGDVTVYARTGLRVNFTPFTPNGTDTYTISFWARLIRGTFIISSAAWCDLTDGNPSVNYTSQLVQDKWVFVTVSAIPTATSKGFFDLLSDTYGDLVIDYWGLKIENQTANNTLIPLKDTVGGYTFNLARPQYSTLSDSDITFTRTATTPKWGGNCYTTGTGSLTSTNFLYNDHTWEIWFRIDDRTPGAYDATEGNSLLAVYQGYHAGFFYDAGTIYYQIWNSTTSMPNCATWTLGTSGTQVIQGNWHQIVVTRTGNVFVPYINGVQLGTGSTSVTSVTGVGTGNNISIGSAASVGSGSGSYVYYSKNSIANMKMYNRALTADEVQQNFNALRGRFNI